MRIARALALALSFLVLTTPAARAGFGSDPYTPMVLAPPLFGTGIGGSVADGSGGMLVSWVDSHVGGTYHPFVQRLTGQGAIAPGWPAGGLQLCNATGGQSSVTLASDGAGGAWAAWVDSRGSVTEIYATHVLASGAIAAALPTDGLLVSTGFIPGQDPNYTPLATSDGAGGMFVAWTLQYSSNDQDVYGAHVTAAGALAWSWGLYAPVGIQSPLRVIPDGTGGFFVGFSDNLNGSYQHAKVLRCNSAGSVAWTPVFVGSGFTTSNQYGVDLAADGAGGVFCVTSEQFGTDYNVTANHYLANGSTDPMWSSTYRPLVPESGVFQGNEVMLADGTGGFIVFFTDSRYGGASLFALRCGPYGLPAVGWPSNAVVLIETIHSAFPYSAVSDGAGGAVVGVLDNDLGDYFLYATHVQANGTIGPGWGYGGNPVDLGGYVNIGNAPGSIVSDGAGGALFSWADTRGYPQYSTYGGVYAQNIDRFGALGDARPHLAKIADVPNDQGGFVSLQWTASPLDAIATRTIAQYTIWRRVPGGVPATGATPSRNAPAAAGAAPRRTTIEAGQVVYWSQVGTQPALQMPGYSAVVATTSDSLPGSNPLTSFMVIAESAGAQTYWASPPDSGYSVDNLAPPAPVPATGTYAAGQTTLAWGAVAVPDLADYLVYRGTTSSFTPSSSNLVGTTTSLGLVDVAAPAYYRIAARDVHGNIGPSTLVIPAGVTGVGGDGPRAWALRAGWSRERGALALALDAPRADAGRIELFDVEGRRLWSGDWRTGGAQSLAFEVPRDRAGRPGLVLARVTSESGEHLVARAVVTP